MAKPINLVLSGGGARGIAHIGIIEILEEQGYEIKAIAGTSMGALVGGVYAAQAMEAYKQWLINADIKEALKMLDFSLNLPGLIKGQKIMSKIDSMLKIKKIEDLLIPYKAVATDLNHNSEVVFNQGKIIDAIRASVSIPTVFTPVLTGDKMLVDGGLVNNIPIDKLPANNLPVIAVCANADVPVPPEQLAIMKSDSDKEYKFKIEKIQNHIAKYLKFKPKPVKKSGSIGYTEIIDKSLHLMIVNNSNRIIQQYKPDLLINISHKLAGTLDFLKAEKIYKVGRLIGQQALKDFIYKN
jgi:NTE family protein